LEGQHFGPELIAYVMYQYHQCHVTQPLLLEQLQEMDIDISTLLARRDRSLALVATDLA
jgi:hypothetical protein